MPVRGVPVILTLVQPANSSQDEQREASRRARG